MLQSIGWNGHTLCFTVFKQYFEINVQNYFIRFTQGYETSKEQREGLQVVCVTNYRCDTSWTPLWALVWKAFGRPLVVALVPHPGALWWDVVGVLTCKLVRELTSSLTRGNSYVLTSWTTLCVLVCKCLWSTRMSSSVPVVVLWMWKQAEQKKRQL